MAVEKEATYTGKKMPYMLYGSRSQHLEGDALI